MINALLESDLKPRLPPLALTSVAVTLHQAMICSMNAKAKITVARPNAVARHVMEWMHSATLYHMVPLESANYGRFRNQFSRLSSKYPRGASRMINALLESDLKPRLPPLAL